MMKCKNCPAVEYCPVTPYDNCLGPVFYKNEKQVVEEILNKIDKDVNLNGT